MKKISLKNFVFYLLILACFGSVLMFPITSLNRISSVANCTKSAPVLKEAPKANDCMYTDQSNIPFSLFTSTRTPQSSQYTITDYYPTFSSTMTNEASEIVYNYKMNESSRPYILLSSYDGKDGEVLVDSDCNELYNTTLYFRFNDPDGITDSTIPSTTGFVSREATVNDQTIMLETDLSNPTTTNSFITFGVNLKELDIENAMCPTINGVDFLGGNIQNDVDARLGLYQFKIRYSYKDIYGISNLCLFEISFYVLDYFKYIQDAAPLTFHNTDTFITDGQETNYELFNYNYLQAPVVDFDATKFGLNIVYEIGYNSFLINYDSFYFLLSREAASDPQIGDGTQTGFIQLKLKNTNSYYDIPTYKYGDVLYKAKFDLENFQSFLIENTKARTFQGTYTFNLDFLVESSSTFKIVDKSLFSIVPKETNTKKLVIFGYDLNFYDQDPNSPTYKKDVKLQNDYTHTTFIAYNDSSSIDEGFLVNIPDYIAITDQAPLRFNSYGNLFSAGGATAEYIITNVSEETVLSYFDDIDSLEKVENQIDSKINNQTLSYNQSDPISGEGIRIMKLVYKIVDKPIEIVGVDGKTITVYRNIVGCQYIVFKITNTIQDVDIRSIKDTDNDGVYDTIYQFNKFTNKDVRINIEKKNNTFFAPVTVSYSYSSTFNQNEITKTGTLSLKMMSDSLYTYNINEKNYAYYVTKNEDNFTFSNSGYYKITIKNAITSVPVTHYFKIDKEDFSSVTVNKVSFTNSTYVKSSSVLTSTSLTQTSEYIKEDMFVTDAAFTLGWKEKLSGADSYVFVYYMEINESDTNRDYSLFKTPDNEYWLTNGYSALALSSAIDTYQNSYLLSNNVSLEKKVNPSLKADGTYFFNKDGLYYFYVFDDAGNYFTKIVLIDSSLSGSLQGRWKGTEEDSEWQNTFDPVNNPANYVNKDTTIYFGTHKAIKLNDLSTNSIITISDVSYLQAYSLQSGSFIKQEVKIPITFNFKTQVLDKLSTFIKSTTLSPIAGPETGGEKYYLTLRNTVLSYVKESTAEDSSQGQIKTGQISDIFKTKIYTSNDPSGYDFNGEAYYDFTLTNLNGKKLLKQIAMNYDVVQGTFYAYGDAYGNTDSHLIRKNSATNLNTLKFVYNILDDSTASYYDLKSLTYDYFEFVVDNSNPLSSDSSYPFSKTETKKDVDLLSSSSKSLNPDLKSYSIDLINISVLGITNPGKYILTRTYFGGDYEKNSDGTFSYVGTGGNYYKVGEGSYESLFDFDSLIRKYVVYVDHNGIITESYMIRNDNQEYIREVGNNVSIVLSSDFDDEWNFKEFFIYSNTFVLDTNKVPVQIIIPLSKYFVYYNSINSNLYSKLSFSKLQASIFYQKSQYFEWIEYKIDDFNPLTGFCSCSKLVSANNPNGLLLFSAAGNYRIEIKDATGYSDPSVTSEDANNISPTTFIYSFTISHLSPEAQMNKTILVNESFETSLLTNEDSSNNFATNIKQKNGDKKDNEVSIFWEDASTPYLAKVNQINIKVDDGTLTKNIAIDLSSLDLYEIASTTNFVDLSGYINSAFIVSFKITFYENIDEPESFDNQPYYRYRYELSLDISKEYVYDITLSYVSGSSTNQAYIDENNNSFAQTLYVFTIDRTKPNTNINRLTAAETFLSNYYSDSNPLKNFKEEEFDISNLETIPSAFTYSFGVSNTFTMSYDSRDTMPYFFVRSYEKYVDEYISITPDMVDTVYDSSKNYYANLTNFGIEYPRFSDANSSGNIISINPYTWYKINYSGSVPLKTLISTATGQTNPIGFYEIIEKDSAGNYRCYTVYFSEYPTDKGYLILEIDGFHEEGDSRIESEADSDITASLMFEISKLSSKFGWGKITVKNELMNQNYSEGIITFTPFDSIETIEERLASLNDFFQTELDSKFSISLSRYNAAFPVTIRNIGIIKNQTTARLSAPKIEEVTSENTTTYNLVFPAYSNKSVLYLIELEIYQRSSQGTWVGIASYTDKLNIPNKKTGLEKGTYKVVYTDNYNVFSYEYILYVGEFYINNFNNEYAFQFNTYVYDAQDNVYYSGGDISITYESKIYSVSVNNFLYSGTDLEVLSTKYGAYDCKTFNLSSIYSYDKIAANQSVGGTYYFEVVYRDKTDNNKIQKTFTFAIFNQLPEVTLTNKEGGELQATIAESNSQIINSTVTISWGDVEGCQYDLLNDTLSNPVSYGILYSRNAKGEYKNGINISRGQIVEEEGFYMLEIKNSKLGNYRSIFFAIQHTDIPLYTVLSNDIELAPSQMENFNLINSFGKDIGSSTDDKLINIIYNALGRLDLVSKEYNFIKNEIGFSTGIFSQNNIRSVNLTNIKHFYTINDFNVIYNNNMNLNIIEFCFQKAILTNVYKVGPDTVNPTPANVGTIYYSTLYLVYNVDNPIKIEFFAVTKVPKTSNLLNGNISYQNEYSNSIIPISFSSNQISCTLTNAEIKDSDITIFWNKLSTSASSTYWYNQGNIILVGDMYGVNTSYDQLSYSSGALVDNKPSLTSTLKGSGSHILKFVDLAGNIQKFSTLSPQDFYTIILIDTVIYYLSYQETEYNPIQYGVFNNELSIVIDPVYINNYSSLNVTVTRNGNLFTGYEVNANVYTFTNSGRYTVQLSGLYGKEKTSLNTAIYNFTLLDSNSARLAYEFVEISGYEILEVIRNNEDITTSLSNIDGRVLSLFVSSNSSSTGNGYYTIKLKYGDNSTNVLTFSFYINDFVPTISSNVEHGETTTGTITLSYNPSYIYEQLGECFIRILTYNQDSKTFYLYGDIAINENSFTDTNGISRNISESNSYYIQVVTKNGNTVLSFRVNRVDPLNTFAIIIIVVAIIALIALIIIVVKLRTRMKIR